MFRKTSTIPERAKFRLTKQQVIDDIETIYRNDDERGKLYYCLDETPPKEHRFERIEEFLKGTQDLEKNSNMLENLKTEMEQLERDIAARVLAIKETAGKALMQN